MVFAAGMGTRMGALTQHTPKPLIKVGGTSLLEHSLAPLRSAGLGRIVVNTHYLADQIVDQLAHLPEIVISHEDTLLETGGGLKKAAPLLAADTVFTMNSDAVWKGPNPVADLARHWRPDMMDALLLLVPPERTHGHLGKGDFKLMPGGRLHRPGPAVYTGLQLIKLSLVQNVAQDVFSMNVVWNKVMQAGRLYGAVYPGHWCDVGQPESLPIAENLLQERSGV